MTKSLHLPKLYAIVDVICFAPQLRTTNSIVEFARDLGEGGVTLLQYRNKEGDTHQMLVHAREIKRVLEGKVKLIMNDRADICVAMGFDGVHLGQDDLPAEAGRLVVGERIVDVLAATGHDLDLRRDQLARDRRRQERRARGRSD